MPPDPASLTKRDLRPRHRALLFVLSLTVIALLTLVAEAAEGDRAACRAARQAVCGDKRPGDGLMRCLAQNADKLPAECRRRRGAGGAGEGALRERLQQRRGDAADGATGSRLASDGALGERLGRRGAGGRAQGRAQGPAPAMADVSYGSHAAQKLDVYLPAQPQGAPVIVMVHGGGWKRGDKASPGVAAPKAAHWLPQGVILVSVNYRMLPDGADPVEQAEDVARAIAFVQREAPGWGGDPAQVVAMGHSAGAHIVALLAADGAMLRAAGAKPVLGTVTLDSAGFDIEALMAKRHMPLYDEAFGSDPALWRAASPTAQLSGRPQPLLLVCAPRTCGEAQDFAAAVQAQGGRAQVLPTELNHAEINRTLGEPGDYTAAVDRFLSGLGVL